MWAPILDMLGVFFSHFLETLQLVELESVNLVTTWNNDRKGVEAIYNMMDRVFGSKQILNMRFIMKY